MTDATPIDRQESPLADMLAQLATELEVANGRVVDAGRPGRLRWTEATIELGVTWEKTGDGGIDLKVVRLGGSLTKANTTTITSRWCRWSRPSRASSTPPWAAPTGPASRQAAGRAGACRRSAAAGPRAGRRGSGR
jgi:hypothetical protein